MAQERKPEEKEKFAREVMTYLDHLYRLAFHLAKEREEARDLVQETFARALSSYDQFSPGTNMKAWLTKILYNLFFDHYHQKKRWVSVDDEAFGQEERSDYWDKVPADNTGPENLILGKVLSMKIAEALRMIPGEFRVPIVLVDMGDFSYAEAADILSCPVGTVRSRLSRGRRLLHKYLKRYVEFNDKGPEEK